MQTSTTDLRIVYDDGCRPQTPHAPADWQLSEAGVRQHLAKIRVRQHLMHSVRKHGQHQGEVFLRYAAEQLVAIAHLEALRIVDEPLPFCPVAARKTVETWTREGAEKRAAELRAMRSGIAA